jgi:hypothetical protein
MKKTTLFVLLLTVALQFTNAQEVITNASIIQMKELGFDETIILSKINSSDVDFDASITALSKLKNSGVSSEVIALVMQKAEFSTKSKTGIYYLAADDSLKPILASVFSGTNQNAVAQQLVSGLINAKVKSQLPKRTSNNVITSRSPEFTFIFDPDTSADNMQNFQGKSPNLFNWWFRVATSPNEFVLVKMRVKKSKNLREVITSKSNMFTSSNGIDPKASLPFKIETIGNNKFTVVPESLEPGEYCFIYQGNVPNGRTNQSVFDFSIK